MAPISEAARNDLYNGLSEVLGPERAETLMTYLPRYDPAEVATRSDIAAVKTDLGVVKSDVAAVKSDVAAVRADFSELRSEFQTVMTAQGKRLDRMYLTLLAGFFATIAAMAGVLFTTL